MKNANTVQKSFHRVKGDARAVNQLNKTRQPKVSAESALLIEEISRKYGKALKNLANR